MNDSTLSQAEIDALLAGAGETEYESSTTIGTTASAISTINTGDLSILLDIINYSLQIQTEHLINRLNVDLYFSNVKSRIRDNNRVRNELQGKFIQIRLDFNTGIIGNNLFIITIEDALKLAEIFTKRSNIELSDVALSSLSDGFVQMMAASNTALSEKFNRVISVGSPQIEILDNPDDIRFPDESQVTHISYTLNPEDSLPINIQQLLSVPLTREFVNLAKSAFREDSSLPFGNEIDIVSAPSQEDKSMPGVVPTAIRPIKYQELSEIRSPDGLKGNIGLLLDINMQLTVELGRTKMQIKKILGLGEGSIIELEKLAGEPVDLLVNGKLIAKGEVVVIDENFGVRITEIVSPHERLDSLFSD